MLAEFEEALTTQRSRKSIDARVAAILKAKASKMESGSFRALTRVHIVYLSNLTEDVLAHRLALVFPVVQKSTEESVGRQGPVC